MYQNHLESVLKCSLLRPLPRVSDSGSLGQDPRMRSSHTFPDDTGTHFENHVLERH